MATPSGIRRHIMGGLFLIGCSVIGAVIGLFVPTIAAAFGYTGSPGLDWTTVVMITDGAMVALLFVVGVVDLLIGVIAAGVRAGRAA